jgi:hypothetical protein
VGGGGLGSGYRQAEDESFLFLKLPGEHLAEKFCTLQRKQIPVFKPESYSGF